MLVSAQDTIFNIIHNIKILYSKAINISTRFHPMTFLSLIVSSVSTEKGNNPAGKSVTVWHTNLFSHTEVMMRYETMMNM